MKATQNDTLSQLNDKIDEMPRNIKKYILCLVKVDGIFFATPKIRVAISNGPMGVVIAIDPF